MTSNRHLFRVIVTALALCFAIADAAAAEHAKKKTSGKAVIPATPPIACPQQFPATGQTTCWNESGAVIACPGTGQDGDIQAGSALSYTDNGDGTLSDNNTKLVWEKQSFDGSIHDMRTAFKWDQAFAHVAELNKANFAGHDDWRLPNLRELESIVDYVYHDPVVAPAFNHDCKRGATVLSGSCTASDFYWSSTTFEFNPKLALRVVFDHGFTEDSDKRSTHHVRAVRGGCK
jgi:uncharacterized protein DUF1566